MRGLTGGVVDPLGGLDDLRDRRVRFIGSAETRIREDYLRSLRFFRFFAWYGDASEGLDADGLAAIASNLDGLDSLSRERVGSEMLKLLAAPDPSQAVAGMVHSGAMARVLNGASDKALGPMVHLEQTMGFAPDAILRLAALGGEGAANALRLSKAQASRLTDLVDAASGLKPAHHLGFEMGRDDALAALILRAAFLESPFDPEDAQRVGLGARARFPVTAGDLMPTYSGKALGEKLDALKARWIASEFSLTKDDLLG